MTTIWIAYKRCGRYWMANCIFLFKRLKKKKNNIFSIFLPKFYIWLNKMCTVFACISRKNLFRLCHLPCWTKWNLFIETWHFGSRFSFQIILCYSSFLGSIRFFSSFSSLLTEPFLYWGENCFHFLLWYFACVPDVDDYYYKFSIRLS